MLNQPLLCGPVSSYSLAKTFSVEFLSQPWPWYVSGALLTGVMVALLFMGKNFGASANLRTLCVICGVNTQKKKVFDLDWRQQRWNLVVMLGAALGGAFAMLALDGGAAVGLSPATLAALEANGITDGDSAFQPALLLGSGALSNPAVLAVLFVGGLLVGFGTRYAGGCTSGHAISGLSNLQPASLVAVIGFFTGGLLVTHLALPYLLPFLAETAKSTLFTSLIDAQ